MDSFGLDKLVEMIKRGKESGKPPLALFVMATTGDGDVSDILIYYVNPTKRPQ